MSENLLKNFLNRLAQRLSWTGRERRTGNLQPTNEVEPIPAGNARIYSFGPFQLVPAKAILARDGIPIRLRPRPFRLLTVLVENHERLMPREELMSEVWGPIAVSPGNLDVTLTALREALGTHHNYVETVHGHGYRFHAAVTVSSKMEMDYSCFISYSSKDHRFAERLYGELQSKAIRCWFAPEDLKIGDKFRDRIDESIRIHDKLLLVLSEHSLASSWVETEVEAAFEKERQQNKSVLFPVRLDDAVMSAKQAWAADIRRTRHIGDFRAWKERASFQRALQRLVRDLKATG